jgi:hypothetical protein
MVTLKNHRFLNFGKLKNKRLKLLEKLVLFPRRMYTNILNSCGLSPVQVQIIWGAGRAREFYNE